MPEFDIRTASGGRLRFRVAVASDPGPQAPAAPTGLTATAVSASAIDLSWADNASGSASFEVQESTDGGATWATATTTAEGATSYTRAGLAASSTYHYRVRAVGDAVASAWSATASATTPADAPGVAPAAPTGLTATAVHDERIDLAWANNDGGTAVGHEVQRSADGGATWATVATTWADPIGVPGIRKAFPGVGLAPATAYAYRVRARDAAGNLSAWSGAASATTYPAAGYQEYVVEDFADPVLHDTAWIKAQPAGTRAPIVVNKPATGVNRTFEIDVGGGRGGSNALKISCPDDVATRTDGVFGLPAFWIYPWVSYGNNYADNPFTLAGGYLLPYGGGHRANRLEIWVRFDPGFRAAIGALAPPGPRYQNINLGSYCFNPAVTPGKEGTTGVVESNNFHFYHQFWIRHDLRADGEWIRLVFNEQPTYQRNYVGQPPPLRPIAPHGGYFETMTRIYLDCERLIQDSLGNTVEAPPARPCHMWVDSIKFIYDPTPPPVEVSIDGLPAGAIVPGAVGVESSLPVVLTNTTAAPLDVRLGMEYQTYTTTPHLSRDGAAVAWGAVVTLAPGPNAGFRLAATPTAAKAWAIGLTACPLDQFDASPIYGYRSLTDSCVERRLTVDNGPLDGNPAGSHVVIDAR